ncbi:MAG: hypothetical protein LUQ24_01480 [Methanobacterium sp.]|nr:hypothetical protein [Methanobacterium sp.]
MLERLKKRDSQDKSVKDGISLIIASPQDDFSLMDSVIKQTIDRSLFEVIIVLNRNIDQESADNDINKGTSEIIQSELDKIQSRIPSLNVRVIKYFNQISDLKLIDQIFNNFMHGLEEVNRKFFVFARGSDRFSPDFLKEIYKKSREDRVVIPQRSLVNEKSSYIPEYEMNNPSYKTSNKQLLEISDLNTGILIPTSMVKYIKHQPYQRMLFFWKILQKIPTIHLLKDEKAVYFFDKSSTAVPEDETPENILKVVKELNHIMEDLENNPKKGLFKYKSSFSIIKLFKEKIIQETLKLNSYLKKHPEKAEDIRKAVQGKNVPYPILNMGLASDLVVSYCFPPYADTSGNNMAKRVREYGRVVDVVQCDMTGMRKLDPHLEVISQEYVENQIIIPSKPSFGGWREILDFIERGVEELSRLVGEKGEYQRMYSRAMFPASHLLAFQFKIKHPQIRWIAEFSDPLIYDIKSQERVVKIEDETYLEMIKQEVQHIGVPEYHISNLFFLAEYLPYLFADELVFTNQNQQEYMTKNFPIKEVQDMIEEKSTIQRHTTLPEHFYHLYSSNYTLEEKYVNLAYFGSFYETRNLNHVYTALSSLEDEYQDSYRLHIFTTDLKEVKKHIPSSIKGQIKVNHYLNYLEFLNLTTRFHCLIVNDSHTVRYKNINPYLPSKYSDYLGSRTPIWSICEEGSALSQLPSRYKSYLDDDQSGIDTARRIIKNEKLKPENYHKDK